MSKRILTLTVISLLFCLVAGCSQEQLQQADRAAENAADVVEAAEGVLNSPAGQLVPPDVRLIGSIAGVLVLGLVNGWQAYRNGRTQLALEEVVIGNEAVKAGRDFADAHNAAQSVSTTAKVAEIRNKVAV